MPSARSFMMIVVLAAVSCLGARAQDPTPTTRPASAPTSRPADAASRPTASDAAPFKFVIPGSVWTATFAPLPPAAAGGKTVWMCTTEIPWQAYDAFVFATDVPEGGSDLDGVTRPSRPYIPPDRGLGHEGYPAISVSFRGADFFCVWLSKRAGGTFRLPTEAEFEAAARAGASGATCVGDDLTKLGPYAWFAENSEQKPHPIGSKTANAWGLFDLHGNVAEWCVGADGRGVTKGGHYLDAAADLAVGLRRPLQKEWQKTDPQIPKSKWWLTDGPFVGFRAVCESLPTNVRIER